jgi:hypothetical protein
MPKPFARLSFLLCASLFLPGCADLAGNLSSLPPADATSAKVTGIYVKLAPGLMMERTGSSAQADLPVFAEVRTQARDGAPSRVALVPLDGINAQPGDTVEVALGDRGTGLITGARPAPQRIVRIIAPAGQTVAQRLFNR